MKINKSSKWCTGPKVNNNAIPTTIENQVGCQIAVKNQDKLQTTHMRWDELPHAILSTTSKHEISKIYDSIGNKQKGYHTQILYYVFIWKQSLV